jgi:hypothetical protein
VTNVEVAVFQDCTNNMPILRLERQPLGLHDFVALTVIAILASSHNVFPTGLSAFALWNHVVQR